MSSCSAPILVDGEFIGCVTVDMELSSIQNMVNSPEPFLSTLVGRYGNRIAKGHFTMNGKDYSLAVNNGPNHLHGGPTGFHARVWDAEQINDQELVLRYVSAYYEE